LSYISATVHPDEDENRRRERIAAAADLCVRARVPGVMLSLLARYLKARRVELIAELVALARDPVRRYRERAFVWALSYGGPSLLRRLIASANSAHPDAWNLKLLQRGRADMVLPRERYVPAYQVVRNSQGEPRNALVCVTGNEHRLSMPVQLFHFAVADSFDLLVYLRDPNRTLYGSGVPGLGTSIEEVAAALTEWVPEGCAVSVLSTSGGGLAAAHLANRLRADRAALFSPPRLSRSPATLRESALDRVGQCRIFFARANSADVERAGEWQDVSGVAGIEWLDTHSHGTLKHVAEQDRLADLVDWLATGRFHAIGQYDEGQGPASTAINEATGPTRQSDPTDRGYRDEY